MSTIFPPLPKLAHELIHDSVLGELACAANAVEADFHMLQVSGGDRDAWLRRMARDAEAVAHAARALISEKCGAEFAGHRCGRYSGHDEDHEDMRTALTWPVSP
jgi:hypothetical protein